MAPREAWKRRAGASDGPAARLSARWRTSGKKERKKDLSWLSWLLSVTVAGEEWRTSGSGLAISKGVTPAASAMRPHSALRAAASAPCRRRATLTSAPAPAAPAPLAAPPSACDEAPVRLLKVVRLESSGRRPGPASASSTPGRGRRRSVAAPPGTRPAPTAARGLTAPAAALAPGGADMGRPGMRRAGASCGPTGSRRTRPLEGPRLGCTCGQTPHTRCSAREPRCRRHRARALFAHPDTRPLRLWQHKALSSKPAGPNAGRPAPHAPPATPPLAHLREATQVHA